MLPRAALPRFSPASLSFLRLMKRNNDREWFKTRKEDYERLVRDPMIALIEQLDRDFRAFAPDLVASPKVSLFRCNDLRWWRAGPATGLAEIHLPDLQPGSSIMPGKVNPVLPEVTLMVCAQVVGNDAAVAWAGAAGNFELNVMQPVIARNVLESIRLLARSTGLLATRCVDGITVDRVRLRRHAEASTAHSPPHLNRVLGYDATAAGRQAGAVRGDHRPGVRAEAGSRRARGDLRRPSSRRSWTSTR